jgi:hypothetical protein
MWRVGVGVLLVGAMGGYGCEVLPPPVTTPPPVATSLPGATVATARPLGVAVAPGTPTPTPVLVGDYATLVRPRLEGVQQGLKQLDQQLAVLVKAPMRMAEDDWRNQTQAVLDDLAAGSLDLRALGPRAGNQTALHTDVMKLLDDLDFVVSEYRMALDYDPDSTHFVRAGRARATTEDEVESILSDLRRPVLPTPLPSFNRVP